MIESNLLFWIVQAFILLLGISIGHSIILLRLRREENRKRELELTLLEKRTDVLRQGRKVAQDLEDALFKAKVQQEIDDMIRKDKG
ncbi:MAG: hypothetical protein LBH93_05140 [Chitinispirillales bacterium]|jgi:uncharacterized membrane-anchored protein YhcB (DUF1043 family)|nr:hypothetical protein [Chitinispirillales bacterium]